MSLGELETFMAAIRRLESGSFAGDYTRPGPTVTSGQYKGERAFGAYQIMPGNWPVWSAAAGYKGAHYANKAAQDGVARFMFRQLYQKYGDWRLVAIAWFAGESRARRAAESGISSVGGIRDVLGTSVSGYVAKVEQFMREAVDAGYVPTFNEDVVGRLDRQAQESIRSHRLSIDDPFLSAEEQGQGPTAEGSGGYTVLANLPGANPDIGALQEAVSQSGRLIPGVNTGTPLDPGLLNRAAHKNMAAILQGLSNAIKAGASAITPEAPVDTSTFDIKPEEIV